MQQHLSKIIIIALLGLVVGVPFALKPAATTGSPDTTAAREKLVIISPHNEQIRYEFARAFNEWRAERGEGPVQFDWRSSGGTSDLRKHIIAQFQAAAEQGREDEGIGSDLFFGGGDYEHNRLADGFTVQRDGRDVHIDIIVPPDLPDGMLAEVFPNAEIGGERLYHPDVKWVGAALSSFGIVYNRDVQGMLDLPEPTTWADLADPRLANHVALADPAHSGSIAATYHVILRRGGWTDGWALLRRAFANARYFTSSASKVPVDVSAGDAAAGMCIDFYGRFQAGAVGGDRVGYVDPIFMTATTPDPVSIIRGAPSRELANQFVVWLLSDDAQQLWQRKRGAPGGPQLYELRRQPIRRDVYIDANRADWADPEIDPFAIARPVPAGVPDFYATVAPIAHAMAIDVHPDLKAAWAVIRNTPDDDPRKAEMLGLFDAMPPELTLSWPEGLEDGFAILDNPDHPRYDDAVAVMSGFRASLRELLADDDAVLAYRLRWTRFFQDNYRRIVRLSKSAT